MKKRVTIDLTEKEYKRLLKQSRDFGLSATEIIRRAINRFDGRMLPNEIKRAVKAAKEMPDPFGMMPEVFKTGYSESEMWKAVDEQDRELAEKTLEFEKGSK